MKIKYMIPILALGFAACETVPPTMEQVGFDEVMSGVEANPSAVSADAAITELLARTDLTEDQRAAALYLRADKRWQAKFNLPGAVEDFEAYLALRPDGEHVPQAKRYRVFAATEIENAERRLAQLQNLPDWFDDKVLMGGLAEGAVRYRKAGLTPTDWQLYTLREGGYICEGEGQSVHRYGPMPSYAIGAIWCSDPSLS